jgi:uncharacterized protein (DUF302 family)
MTFVMRLVLLLLVNLSLPWTSIATGSENPIITYWVEEEFENIRDNVRNAIIERGMNIASELHASEMLNRTAPDLGIERNVFLNAVSIEFCSAMISHKLVMAHASNMVLCPFTISIYVLSEDPAKVFVAYKPPTAGDESSEVLEEIKSLLQAIVTESLE